MGDGWEDGVFFFHLPFLPSQEDGISEISIRK